MKKIAANRNYRITKQSEDYWDEDVYSDPPNHPTNPEPVVTKQELIQEIIRSVNLMDVGELEDLEDYIISVESSA